MIMKHGKSPAGAIGMVIKPAIASKPRIITLARGRMKPLPIKQRPIQTAKPPIEHANARKLASVPVRMAASGRQKMVASGRPLMPPSGRARSQASGVAQAPTPGLKISKPAKIIAGAPIDRRFEAALHELKNSGMGKALVIIANGPSHKEADLTKLLDNPKIDMMSVNKPDDRVWPTKYWIFCDNSQQKRHGDLWNQYQGTIFNSSCVREEKPNTVKVRTLYGKGFSQNLFTGMYIGRSSTYAALQVGCWMNYDNIYIFGCDMAAVGGKLYPWGSNPDVNDKSRLDRFKIEAESYEWASNNAAKSIIDKIIFCGTYNPWPFIKKFRSIDHTKAADVILESVKAQ